MLVAAANYSARPLMEVAPFAPPKLAQIVDKALMFEKEMRWANARAMQTALRAVPGRPSMGAQFDSGQRSINDDHPASFDDRTVMDRVEELDPNELEDRAPSWQGNDRTLAVENVNVPRDAVPSGYPPPRKPTSAPPPDVGAPVQGDRTLVMGGAPAQPPVAPVTERFGDGPRPRMPSMPGTPQAFAASGGTQNDMMFVAGPARPAPPTATGSSKFLVYLGVAALSMIIVVVTGLIILAASD
jgi:hypothetical protein